MTKELIAAGFGGQGVMLLGTLLSYAGMLEGKNVSWMPSYGPEQRGGTANCSVVISDEPIGSPVVTEPDILIVMNLPSLVKFEPTVRPGGLIMVNSTLVTRPVDRTDLTVVTVPATATADELGNLRMANMVILGATVAATPLVRMDSLCAALYKVFPHDKQDLVEPNRRALWAGYELVEKSA